MAENIQPVYRMLSTSKRSKETLHDGDERNLDKNPIG